MTFDLDPIDSEEQDDLAGDNNNRLPLMLRSPERDTTQSESESSSLAHHKLELNNY